MQNIKLLGGMAPTVSMEQLAYATRLLNQAAQAGQATTLRDWLVGSDMGKDPQAYVLRPDVVLKLAAEIVAEPTAYLRTRRAALAVLEALRRGPGRRASSPSANPRPTGWAGSRARPRTCPRTKGASSRKWWPGPTGKGPPRPVRDRPINYRYQLPRHQMLWHQLA